MKGGDYMIKDDKDMVICTIGLLCAMLEIVNALTEWSNMCLIFLWIVGLIALTVSVGHDLPELFK